MCIRDRLCMDTYQKDLRKAEFEKAFFEYWKHEDKEKNYQIARKAASEYPGNMAYVEWLASAEYYVALQTSDEATYQQLLESSIKHYNICLLYTSIRGRSSSSNQTIRGPFPACRKIPAPSVQTPASGT